MVASNGASVAEKNTAPRARFVFSRISCAAQSKNNSDTFASQAECDQTAQELQEASDAFAAIVPNVGTLYTNAMILEAVKNGGAVNPQYSSEFAYSAEMQPLRKDYTYCLYGSSWTVPGSNVTVSIDWSVSGDGAQYLAFAPEGGHDHKTICTATA